APSVEEVSKKFSGKVRIVGVAWNGTDDSYLEFIDRHSLTFNSLDDTSALIFSEYEIPSQPAWAFMKQDGALETRLGVIPQDELVNLLEALSY
ncbi:MAG: hypothetical protein NWR75_06535, partial [Ilumatobacteraceae bacterium]|nr:hypothetical protein [Ilumatobacteraceae bacterium]